MKLKTKISISVDFFGYGDERDPNAIKYIDKLKIIAEELNLSMYVKFEEVYNTHRLGNKLRYDIELEGNKSILRFFCREVLNHYKVEEDWKRETGEDLGEKIL